MRTRSDAGSLSCPACGAPVAPEQSRCAYCGGRVALVACPTCLAVQFVGSQHCTHCGSVLARTEDQTSEDHPCPHCRVDLGRVRVGPLAIEECPTCHGTWVETRVFEQLCQARDGEATLAGIATVLAAAPARRTIPTTARYIPCPVCARLMNRLNFARCSGVIVDTCKAHGVWFDADELRRIVAFVREGGLAKAREREREDLQEEVRRLKDTQANLQRQAVARGWKGQETLDSGEWTQLIGALGGLLSHLK